MQLRKKKNSNTSIRAIVSDDGKHVFGVIGRYCDLQDANICKSMLPIDPYDWLFITLDGAVYNGTKEITETRDGILQVAMERITGKAYSLQDVHYEFFKKG